MIDVYEDSATRQAFISIDNLEQATRRGIRQGFFRSGQKLRADARRNIIKGPKTGRLYRVRGRKRRHRASAPGESPANLTGNLQRSVGFQIYGMDRMEFGYRESGGGARSGSAFYGKFLELGTHKRATGQRLIEPRPNLNPTVKRNNRNVQRYMESAIMAEHRRGR